MTRTALIGLLCAVLCANSAAGAGCGSRGGPGYRGPDGRCVGWANLKKVCGEPPTSHCTAEGAGALGRPAPLFSAPIPSAPPNPERERPESQRTFRRSTPSNGSLPLNPDVTQATIDRTICVIGWTSTIRPPASYTNAIKVRLIREQGLPLELIADFKLDHKIPLALGGAPSDPRNLQLEDADEADEKDSVEKCLARAVCSGTIGLGRAQELIWRDWRSAHSICR